MKSVPDKSIAGFCILVTLFIFSCGDDDPDLQHPVSIENLSGLAQKGPYLNGTAINVAELTAGLVQTGRSFNTQITDNRGSFELKNISLSSQFVELFADGFYFNEVSGESSSARLILYALSDLEDRNTLNVNLISHLERNRVYHLHADGISFAEAKKQAQQEVLEIFSISKPDMLKSELLDISEKGDDHAILLAISLILQGHRSVAELSELLAEINLDIREDGELNSSSLGTELVNHALWLNLSAIRKNLENKYKETGLEVTLPGFEPYVDYFIQNTNFESTAQIEYPEFSDYGENILFGDKNAFIKEEMYSMAADLPPGAELTVRLSGGLWGYETLPDGPVNWDVSDYDWESESQVFSSIESGRSCDLIITFLADTTATGEGILVEYFEDQSGAPTRTKMITMEEPF